ncbi:killer cell lectin-like receptor 5 isoform X2 [Fukomys damarensis]|uniref:killer cell lectin-like receptor 5 isoform X2 n=1 Tax=Fukomys damarensis TaxID=885580 RepID=UPI00053FF973|nr:killer cell lectin-like receptor 5 isoform X2 [Fukomys damarensis]
MSDQGFRVTLPTGAAEMSEQRMIYSELNPVKVPKRPPRKFSSTKTSVSTNEQEKPPRLLNLQSHSASQRRPGHGSDHVWEGYLSPSETPFAALLGTVFLISKAFLLAATVSVFLFFQCIQEKQQQQEILANLRQEFNITQNASTLKELLTNKTLEYDVLKSKTHWQKVELESLSKSRCHKKNKIFSKLLQNSGKICEGHLTCYGVKCYYFIMDSKDWNSCKQTCQNYRLSFVTIEDKDELDFLRLQLGGSSYWIWLSFDTGENGWKWTESGASPGMKGKCACLSATGISNIACSKTYNCICEKRMNDTFPASLCSEEKRESLPFFESTVSLKQARSDHFLAPAAQCSGTVPTSLSCRTEERGRSGLHLAKDPKKQQGKLNALKIKSGSGHLIGRCEKKSHCTPIFGFRVQKKPLFLDYMLCSTLDSELEAMGVCNEEENINRWKKRNDKFGDAYFIK